MKKNIAIYLVLILLYVYYNLFFPAAENRIRTAVNLLIGSFLMAYMACIAYSYLKNPEKKRKR
ncbi:MAG: hypothetical protein FDW93_06635 [Bergeyella sp.]|nr:hypothetical protein [Bergeyella sp.]